MATYVLKGSNSDLSGGADFDKESGTWQVKLSDGSKLISRFVITAVGPLSNPSIPQISGKETFKGAIFHSAHWDHNTDLKDKKIIIRVDFNVPLDANFKVTDATRMQAAKPTIIKIPTTENAR